MPRTHLRTLATTGAWVALGLALAPAPAPAENRPPITAIARPPVESRLIVPSRPPAAPGSPGGSGGWWLGTAGIAAALAVFGGASLASKRFLPARDSGPLRVIGRVALSPKHSVYLLRVGDRVLVLGAGPQGSPSTLGEVIDPIELARLTPRRAPRPGPETAPPTRPSPAFDHRIGDDE